VKMARGYERGRGVIGMMRHAKEEAGDEEVLKGGIGKLWLRGVEVGWEEMREGEKRRRIGLPTYPFEKQRFWVDYKVEKKNDSRSVRVIKKGNIADWFYLPVWKQSLAPLPISAGDLANETACWLVFADTFGIGSRMARRLADEGQKVITVVEGQQFARLSHNSFEIDPRDPEDYESLLQMLARESRTPNKVVHLWSVTPANQTASTFQAFEKAQETGFYSLIHLAQALSKQSFIETINFEVISNNLQKVNSSDIICAEKATLLGPCKVIPQEYPNIICRSIDVIISGSDSEREALAEQLAAEVTAKPSTMVIAYRGNDRWVESFDAVRVEAGQRKPRLRQSGTYLITGGLGLIGLDLAEHLAKKFQARLALVGRSVFPARDTWAQWLETHAEPDPISQKIRRLQVLEASGAEVLVINADVAEPQDMRRAVNQTRERFGALHGIIHGAGIFDRSTFLPIQEIGQAECKRHFQPKVQGVLSLSEALQGVDFDFCLLLSSVASVLGGLGFVAYSAANLFMDAFAQEQNKSCVSTWISANWDGWQRSDQSEIDASMGGAGASLAGLIMTPQEGAEVFERVVSLGTAAQVVISTGDLQARINTWIKLTSLRGEQEEAPASSYTLYQRPNLEQAYTPASNDLERKLVEIWQQVLGIDQLGIHDNFFELGGHSLLAIRLISRLREGFQVEVSLTNLFQSPTVAGLAVAIVQAQARQFDNDLLAQVLAELEEIPADNAQG
jgi:acyl transferase domain-containing protein